MVSLQTNITSLIAQNNLNADNQLQNKSIQQLTSGYRINSSGDDAAGLAIANGYRSRVAELAEGLQNATNATAQLQILDSGLSNISTILDRLKTLATESASSIFTGDRNTLNQEYSGLLSEINRQAAKINLNAGGSMNSALSVFIGDGSNAANSSVAVDLSGAENTVDASSLGLTGRSVVTTKVVTGLPGNTQRLDTPGANFLSGSSSGSESFKFNLVTPTGPQTVTAVVNGSLGGITEAAAILQLNSQLNQYGLTAGLDSNGLLGFSGATPFNLMSADLKGGATKASALVTQNWYIAYGELVGIGFGLTGADTETLNVQTDGMSVSILLNSANASSIPNAIATIDANVPPGGSWAATSDPAPADYLAIFSYNSLSVSSISSNGADEFLQSGNPRIYGGDTIPSNTANYVANGLTSPAVPTPENLSINVGGQLINVALTVADQASLTSVEAAINAQTTQYGVFALTNYLGTGVDLQSASAFTVTSDVAGVFASNNTAVSAPTNANNVTTISHTPPSSVDTVTNAKAAITAINSAVQALGLVQGRVGAGQNKLAYASSLAQSQISGYSEAESQIRDADVAAQAADLTKAQVLVQTSVAALAQANSAPQAILKLLQ